MQAGMNTAKGSTELFSFRCGFDSHRPQMSTFTDFIRDNPSLSEEVTERAAIMEYDGGMSRAQAEEAAILRVWGKRQRPSAEVCNQEIQGSF